jgi:hypothetical protein
LSLHPRELRIEEGNRLDISDHNTMLALIDSQRLAAFRLGFHVRLLKSILGTGIEGDIQRVQGVHGCLRELDEAAFVLADKITAAEHSNLGALFHRVGELHDTVCEIGPVEETLIERGAFQKLEGADLERIEFLARRVVQKDPTLDAWREVGIALAELRHRVAYVYKTVPIPDVDWEQLNSAVDRLPSEDHRLARPFFRMEHRNLTDLGIQIRDAYDDICQCLSSPDRQQEPTRPSAPVVPPPPSPSVELRGQGKPPLVLGTEKNVLTFQQYNVISALLEAGSGGLNKDELETKSGHTDARKILKRLFDSDSDWKKVIILPGRTGRRYRLRFL